MKLLFERSVPGRRCSLLPACDVPVTGIPAVSRRKTALRLPELSEVDLSRHYTELAKQVYGVNDGFYPLGSCTMKYNPALNEEIAALPGFTGIHPLQPQKTAQGCLEVLYRSEKLLCELTGMSAMTFQPAAGAHGELTGLLIIKAVHKVRGNQERNEIIVPDSAHGTNPASAAMAGFTVINIPSGPDGCVDLEELRKAAGPKTAGLMLTNPNTVGLFDPNILEITRIVHEAGGLAYYDGANMNAVMGVARPGDMGFDIVHLNLHKTFSTPHGGGGPGAGAVGVREALASFLPQPHVCRAADGSFLFEVPQNSIGCVRAFSGNFLVIVRALCYLLALGKSGLGEASRMAVLNANYLKALLTPCAPPAVPGVCMHEFVLTCSEYRNKYGVTALDIAKSMLDCGIHAPTMYFPMIVHEALMFEPTETESKESLDSAAEKIIGVFKAAASDPARLKSAPHTTAVGRPDEVKAARTPVLRYAFHEL